MSLLVCVSPLTPRSPSRFVSSCFNLMLDQPNEEVRREYFDEACSVVQHSLDFGLCFFLLPFFQFLLFFEDVSPPVSRPQPWSATLSHWCICAS